MVLERCLGYLSYHLFIVYHQNGALGCCLRGGVWLPRKLFITGGKKNFKRAPFARRTVDADCSLMRMDNAQSGRQAQASSGKLRGEERIKDSCSRLFVHPTAVVANLDIDVFPWCQHSAGECRPDIIRIQVLRSCPDKYRSGAILSNGLAAIENIMY